MTTQAPTAIRLVTRPERIDRAIANLEIARARAIARGRPDTIFHRDQVSFPEQVDRLRLPLPIRC